MKRALRRLRTTEDGFTLVELVTVMVILSVVLGGIVAIFTAGLNSDADLNRRFAAQADARLGMDKLRREIHSACTVIGANNNTAVSAVALSFTTSCTAASTATVTWCTGLVSAGRYALYRVPAATCGTPSSSTPKFADYLTSGTVFTFIPQNAHTTSIGGGAGSLAATDGSYALPRLHVDMTVNRNTSKPRDAYRLVDDIAFRNGVRQ